MTLERPLFGDADPMNKVVSLDNKKSLTVTGVYQDFPYNASFRDVSFIAPWEYYADPSVNARMIFESRLSFDDFAIVHRELGCVCL